MHCLIAMAANARDDKPPASAHPPRTQQVSAVMIHAEISLLEGFDLVHPPK